MYDSILFEQSFTKTIISTMNETAGTVMAMGIGGCGSLSSIVFAHFISVVRDFLGEFHNFESILLLAVVEHLLVDRIVDTHADQTDEADDHANHE